MTAWIYTFGAAAGAVSNQGTTRWLPIAGGCNVQSAEDGRISLRVLDSLTASNLWCRVTANNGTQTLTSRISGANGAQSVSITGTGTFEDTTHTDSLLAADDFDVQIVVGATHTNTVTLSAVSCLLDDGGANVPILLAAFSAGTAPVSSTNYVCPVGDSAPDNATEANAQYTFRATATLSNLRVFCNSNTSQTYTIKTRINGADGTQVISYTSGQTGAKTDATHSDSVSAGDKVCYSVLGGTGSGALGSFQIKSASSGFQIGIGMPGTGIVSQGASTSNFIPLSGSVNPTPVTTTEANAQVKARAAQIISKLFTNIKTNTRSDATTIDFRVGGASSALTVSIGASTTGIVEDLTHSVTLATTDLINFRILTGGGTGTITPSVIGIQQGTVTASVVIPNRIYIKSQAVNRSSTY